MKNKNDGHRQRFIEGNQRGKVTDFLEDLLDYQVSGLLCMPLALAVSDTPVQRPWKTERRKFSRSHQGDKENGFCIQHLFPQCAQVSPCGKFTQQLCVIYSNGEDVCLQSVLPLIITGLGRKADCFITDLVTWKI